MNSAKLMFSILIAEGCIQIYLETKQKIVFPYQLKHDKTVLANKLTRMVKKYFWWILQREALAVVGNFYLILSFDTSISECISVAPLCFCMKVALC